MEKQLELETINGSNYKQLSYSHYISKLDKAKNKDDFKMTKELYSEIMASNNPKIYLSLFTSSSAFNRSYYGCYKNNSNITNIDMPNVFSKLLQSNDSTLISIGLNTLNSEIIFGLTNDRLELECTYDKCILMIFDYLKENPNDELLCQIIKGVNYNWNKVFNYIIEYKNNNDIDNYYLWNYVIKNSILSKENIILLLKNNIILSIMYLIKCNTKFSKKHLETLNICLQLKKIKEEVIAIDEKLYEHSIKPLITKLIDEEYANRNEVPSSFMKSLSEISNIYLGDEEEKEEDLQCRLFDFENITIEEIKPNYKRRSKQGKNDNEQYSLFSDLEEKPSSVKKYKSPFLKNE